MNSPKTIEQPRIARTVQRAINELRDRHALGLEINSATRMRDGSSTYGLALVKHFARGDGSSNSYAYDARKLATSYTSKQLARVIDLCTRYNMAISPSHLIELMRLRDRKLRGRLETKVARERWPVRRLKKEIKEAVAA